MAYLELGTSRELCYRLLVEACPVNWVPFPAGLQLPGPPIGMFFDLTLEAVLQGV